MAKKAKVIRVAAEALRCDECSKYIRVGGKYYSYFYDRARHVKCLSCAGIEKEARPQHNDTVKELNTIGIEKLRFAQVAGVCSKCGTVIPASTPYTGKSFDKINGWICLNCTTSIPKAIRVMPIRLAYKEHVCKVCGNTIVDREMCVKLPGGWAHPTCAALSDIAPEVDRSNLIETIRGLYRYNPKDIPIGQAILTILEEKEKPQTVEDPGLV